MVFICCLEATSGLTPPNGACKSIWEATTLERIRRPSSTTAAAVSSQEVSIPRIRTGGLSNWASLLLEVFGIFCFLCNSVSRRRSGNFYWQDQIHGVICQQFHCAIRACPKTVFKANSHVFI